MLLIGIVMGAIGFVGYTIYVRQTPPDAAQTETQLKKITLKHEKLSFEVPTDFAVREEEVTDHAELDPGNDKVILMRANGFEVSIQSGRFGEGVPCDDCKQIHTMPVTFLGTTHHLSFIERGGTGKVSNIALVYNPENISGADVKSKNIRSASSGEALPLGIYISYRTTNDFSEKTVEEMTQSKDFQDAIKIIESGRYE